MLRWICSDISNVSRPFLIAEKWCNILCEEFFRQGDEEKATGIGLSSLLNDRDNVDKPKNQIGFYNFICLPTYQTLTKVFPKLTTSTRVSALGQNEWPRTCLNHRSSLKHLLWHKQSLLKHKLSSLHVIDCFL